MNYKVIFHKPLRQPSVCFPKVILLGVWAEGIYESDFSRPRKSLQVLSSIFLLWSHLVLCCCFLHRYRNWPIEGKEGLKKGQTYRCTQRKAGIRWVVLDLMEQH